jgi:hypothetical protein
MRRAKTFEAATLALGLGLLATPAFAGWQDTASAFDANRLAKLSESKARGLEEAGHGASPSDLASIHGVLDAVPVQASASDLAGTWRCRTIKLGGMTPDVIYGWFRCRISDEGGALHFAKISGSQRMSGSLYADQSGALVYLGASNVRNEPAHAYSGGGAAAGAQATPDDQIGLLVSTGHDSARLELPYPVQESTFDVVELKR